MKLRSLIFFAFAAFFAVPASLALALTFTDWQAAHFTPTELADPAQSGLAADSDSDGLPNLHEYHFGSDPRLPDSPAYLPVLEIIDGTRTLRHRHAFAAEDTLAWLQSSSDLRHWITYGFEAEVARDELPGAFEITHADLEAHEPARRFLRLRVDLAPFDFSLRAPSGLTLTIHEPARWALAWNDLNISETGHEIQRLSPRTGLWQSLAQLAHNKISWTHLAADSAAGIHYRVLARDGYGNTLASETISPPDSDGDGLPDALELGSAYFGAPGTFASSPHQASDPLTGILDNWAPLYGYSGTPGSGDADGDGLTDLVEGQNHLDPFSDDTDRDGRTDAWELANGQDPLQRHSPYQLLHLGFTPIQVSLPALRANFNWSSSLVWDDRAYFSFPFFPAEHAENLEVYTKALRDAFGLVFVSYLELGSTGIFATEARDYLPQEHGSGGITQDHNVILVWPPAQNDPYVVKGTPQFNDSYVSEGFPAQWGSSAKLEFIDLTGRLWAWVNTSAHVYQLRIYSADASHEVVVQTDYGSSSGHVETNVLQSNGPIAIGHRYGLHGGETASYRFFVGSPTDPADEVDAMPVALNRRGDVLFGDPEDTFYYNPILDAGRTATHVLRRYEGSPASPLYSAVRLASDGSEYLLPIDLADITGFDDEANVYGRDLAGVPVVLMADPEAWGHPPGTPRYTATPYAPPVLPNGLAALNTVSPDPRLRPELVQIRREDTPSDTTGSGYLLLPASLAVDYNRDGQIDLVKDTETDATSHRRVFRFWSNDDDDELFDQSVPFLYDELSEDDRDNAATTIQDWQDNKIDSLRDLEDFARLHLSLGGLHDAFRNGQLHLGLKWTDTGGTSPSIKIYRSADPAGSSSYLFNATAAGQQAAQTAIIDARYPDYDLSNTNFASNHTVISGSETFVLRTIQFSGLTATSSTVPFLFEVCSPGKGQLKLVILKKEGEAYTEIGEGAGVWFEFKRPGELIERYSCGDEHLGAVSPVYRHANSGQFPAPFKDEEMDYVLYVHGYNMDEFEKQRWIETTHKRLHWLGYKGRVGGFTWPCAQDFYPFDGSEERAWSAASELKTHLENLKARGYRVHVLAHSQGNIVMGEALRQAGPGSALVTTYIATQAAVAASAFNPNALSMPNPGNDTPDFYTAYPPSARPYFAAVDMSGAATRYVNFYNRDDYALSSTSGNLFSWEKDQQLKPHSNNWQYFSGFFEPNSSGGFTPRVFPEDRFRIFSFGAEAKSLALGTIPTGGVFTGFTNLRSSYGYGTHHIYHSGQFRASNAERYQYWMGLLDAALIPRLTP